MFICLITLVYNFVQQANTLIQQRDNANYVYKDVLHAQEILYLTANHVIM
jgi:hypothetical protein